MMTAVGQEAGAAAGGRCAEPRLHSQVIDRLPDNHPLAKSRVSCERCEAILHSQSNRCVRTWIESGSGNFCLYCFVVAVGEIAPNATRRARADSLPSRFALELLP
jgi:hypothetical protein